VDPVVVALIAGAAVLHVAWNVLLKTANDPLRTAAIGMLAGMVIAVPVAVAAWLAGGRASIPVSAVALGVVSGFIEAGYFVLLAGAYRRGDLSVVYPIARGTAPLLAVVVGVVVLGERLGPVGSLGVGLLLVGLAMLQRPWRLIAARRDGTGIDPAVPFALATGVTIVAYSAVDRVAVQQVSPWIYAGILWPVCVVALWGWIGAASWRRREARSLGAAAAPVSDPTGLASGLDISRALLGGFITLAAYYLVLAALSVAPLAAVAPLRESAIVLATGWGAIRLGEAADRGEAARRIAAAGLVVAGALLLAFG
jgi:multidrug transporter EmrE-like cation transporter